MIKILSLKLRKDIEYVLGTSVEILAILSEDKPYSITITILDPTSYTMVDKVAMSRVNTGIYNYIYQSASTDQDGEYIATVSVSDGTKTTVRQITFILPEQLD